MANILDFTDNGGGIIEIPQFLDSNEKNTVKIEIPEFPHTSLIFFKKPSIQLLEIEQDISIADTDERRSFLEKYKTLLAKYASQNVNFGKTYWNRYKGKNTISAYYKQYSIHVSIFDYQLRHSLAWYMQSCLKSEINLHKNDLEIQYGIMRFHTEEGVLKSVLSMLQDSTAQDIKNNLIANFKFSEIQANEVMKIGFRQIVKFDNKRLKEDIKQLEEMNSFLEELRQ